MKEPIISVQNLSKEFQVYRKQPGFWGAVTSLWNRTYETVHAVTNVTFSIESGEIVGFIGQNGAGKTTTLKMLSGLLYPTAGTVSVLGHNPWKREPAFQKQFSLVLGQKNQLWWDLPPMESFLLNQAIYEIPDKLFHQTLSELSELLDVTEVLNTQVRKLSLGQRMKCELIAALLHQPKVIFLDEPTIGLDVVMQKAVRDFIKEYNAKYEATIILTSHYMDDVTALCKRALIIDTGKLVFDGKLQNIIDTYAHSKKLSLVFSEALPPNALDRYGIVTEFTEDGSTHTATVTVARKEATQIAAQILAQFPVEDLTIEEAPIEAIIREVFSAQKKSTTEKQLLTNKKPK